MTEDSDLPSLWTHEPHIHLAFRTGAKVADIETDATPGFRGSKSDAPALQAERNERFAELQEMLYANSREGDTRSVLLVLQGMDTAGKGGVVKHVVGAGNPQGIRYTGFGVPTEEERKHHYLWRIRNALPPAGHIGVFDRSHYEEVLVVRVHNLVPPEVWGTRYDEINAFEKELVDGGMTIIKVAMFVSLKEQKKRLAQRLERPDKYWKYNPGDIDERLLWPPTRRPTRRCWIARRRTTRRGISCRATGSGTAGWRSSSCSSKPLRGSTCPGRRRFRHRSREEAAGAGLTSAFGQRELPRLAFRFAERAASAKISPEVGAHGTLGEPVSTCRSPGLTSCRVDRLRPCEAAAAVRRNAAP